MHGEEQPSWCSTGDVVKMPAKVPDGSLESTMLPPPKERAKEQAGTSHDLGRHWPT